MVNEILQKLETSFNDPKFKFDPKYHKYTYDGKRFISVTQLISKFHKPFESDHWSRVKAEEEGVTQQEILDRWKELNDRANEIGTATHDWIENYYNKVWQEIPNDSDVVDRINKFNLAVVKWLHKLKPIKFEQRIFSHKWKIAGMMDALFMYKGDLFIVDYKTNKNFTHDEHENGKFEKLLYPFNDFFKNHLNEYSIQVSLYKLILKEVGIDVKTGYLLYIGPKEEAKIYRTHDFSDILEKYFIEEQTKNL